MRSRLLYKANPKNWSNFPPRVSRGHCSSLSLAKQSIAAKHDAGDFFTMQRLSYRLCINTIFGLGFGLGLGLSAACDNSPSNSTTSQDSDSGSTSSQQTATGETTTDETTPESDTPVVDDVSDDVSTIVGQESSSGQESTDTQSTESETSGTDTSSGSSSTEDSSSTTTTTTDSSSTEDTSSGGDEAPESWCYTIGYINSEKGFDALRIDLPSGETSLVKAFDNAAGAGSVIAPANMIKRNDELIFFWDTNSMRRLFQLNVETGVVSMRGDFMKLPEIFDDEESYYVGTIVINESPKSPGSRRENDLYEICKYSTLADIENGKSISCQKNLRNASRYSSVRDGKIFGAYHASKFFSHYDLASGERLRDVPFADESVWTHGVTLSKKALHILHDATSMDSRSYEVTRFDAAGENKIDTTLVKYDNTKYITIGGLVCFDK